MADDQPGVYSGTLDPGSTYGKCFLDVSYASFDTSDDLDDFPEKRIPASAKLTLSPNVSGSLLGSNSQIVIVTPTTVTAVAGHFEFWCIDGNHTDVNPSGWNWNAKLTVDGATVGAFNFSPDSSLPDPINLGSFFPVTDPQTGQVLLQGPPGRTPVIDMIGDQITVDGVITGPHLTGPAGTGTGGGVTSYNDLTDTPALKTVATTGSYTDLINTPALKTVATSGLYSDLTGTPTLQTVATTGSYTDLTNAPVLDSVAISGLYSDLTGTPVLKPVATSGLYSDLTGTPALKLVATSGVYSDLTGKPVLQTVATSGSYTDLINKPTIPTTAADIGAATAAQGAKADTAVQPAGLAPYAQTANVVPTTRTVNGKALSANISLVATDVGAATTAQGAKADTAVQPAALTPYAQTANVVPTTRTVNGKALSTNISLAASDVGAATAAQGTKADAAIPAPATPADGAILSYDSSSGLWIATGLTFNDIQGVGTLAQLAPGSRFTTIYSTTTNGGAGGWTYNGAYITARPTSRTDIFMSAIDYTGVTAGTAPAFAVAGDSYDVKTA